MIPATELQPPQPPQPHPPSTSCARHPEERFTGFCPLCLCERLAELEPTPPSPSRKPSNTTSTAAAALKAIFRPSASSVIAAGGAVSSRNKHASFFPELRRSKSFSASKNAGFSGVFEPQRKSCDVRARNTLGHLFNHDNEGYLSKKETCRANNGVAGTEIQIELRNFANFGSFAHAPGPVLESKEEDECDLEEDHENGGYEAPNVDNVIEERVQEIVEEEEEVEEEPEQEPGSEQEEVLKTMKDHIDLDSQTKKPTGRDFKEIAGSFWSAASVFSKKWQKWREKQKFKKRRNGGGSSTLPVEKPIGHQFRETQSEIAEYGFGRRSCDTDPRFSVDAGRFSVDDPRYSFDEPRASWDGYLISRTFSRMPTMLSVVEDSSSTHVLRTDTQIPVEEPMNSINENDDVPGGSSQTRDYYSDSSHRRKSLDLSSSIRKTTAAAVAEIDEMKSVSNAKVMPAASDIFQIPKMAGAERVLRESNSMRDDCSEDFGERRESKKSRRWSKGWNIWSLINRRSGNRYEEDERFRRPNVVERSLSESWQELRFDRNGDSRGTLYPKSFRSNSSVSWRNAQNPVGSLGHIRRNSIDLNWNGNGRNKRDDYAFERNNSARYSLSHLDNGVLRLLSAPLKGSRRSAPEKTRPSQAHWIARSVLRLY